MRRRRSSRWMAVLSVTLLLVLTAVPVAAQDEGEFPLTILHTNDVHAHIEQFNSSGGECSEDAAAAGECFGGVSRRATKINEVMSSGDNVILVDAGDEFQGSLFFTQYKGAATAELMDMLGYQAMAVGNHEFDDGPATLGEFIDSVPFPVLSANIVTSAEPALDGKILASAVLDVNGEQIGVVGLTTKTTPTSSSPGDTVSFEEYVPALEPVIASLEEQGINKIILLTHIGYVDDQELAAEIDGVDVIVGGHSHTLLSNTDEDASGPYPTVVNAPNGNPVLIVQDGAYGRALGNLQVVFDTDGVPTSWSGEPIVLDATVEEDPAILARVQELAVPLEELRNAVVGETVNDLDGDRTSCRFGECTMGNLITDAMLWGTQNDGTQVAIENGGGIRSSILAGEVAMGDVLEVLPFGNTAATFGLIGSDLLLALENGVSVAENPDNEGTGRFPQVSGLRFSWDGSKPAGERIVSAEVRNADGSYSPVEADLIYQIVTNDFNRRGGDEYTVFADNAIDPYDFGSPLDQIVADYIGVMSPVDVQLDGRITRVDSPTPAPTEEPTAMPTEAPPTELPPTGSGPSSWPLLAALLVVGVLAAAQLVRQRGRLSG